jgi:nucleotide-binding universal stress UspA family protein
VLAPFLEFSLEGGQVEGTSESYRAHREERAAHILDQAGRVAAAAGVTFEARHVEEDQPYRAIIREAEQNGCELIVMASHGLRGMSTLVLGSETVKVLTHTFLPVLVYRAVELHGERRSHEGHEGSDAVIT